MLNIAGDAHLHELQLLVTDLVRNILAYRNAAESAVVLSCPCEDVACSTADQHDLPRVGTIPIGADVEAPATGI